MDLGRFLAGLGRQGDDDTAMPESERSESVRQEAADALDAQTHRPSTRTAGAVGHARLAGAHVWLHTPLRCRQLGSSHCRHGGEPARLGL